MGADNKDVTRNVARAGHLDDPQQRAIYEAETYKIAPLKQAHQDQVAQHEKEQREGCVRGPGQ